MTGSRRRRKTIRSATAELLGGLGTTSADVAATLELAGVRGVRRSGTSCAIARYLNAVMAADPEVLGVMVSCEGVTVSVRQWWSPDIMVPVPAPIRQFIRQFDSGDFCALVADRDRELRPQ
jgi:hypothetical protein